MSETKEVPKEKAQGSSETKEELRPPHEKTREETRARIKANVEKFFHVSLDEIERRFEIINKFFDMLRGAKSPEGKLAPLTQPKGIATITMARLTPMQAVGVSSIFTLEALYGFFLPLKKHGEYVCYASIGINGEGRRESISFMGADQGSQFLRSIGLTLAPTAPTDLQRKKAEKKGTVK